jgi:hypothetical protein
MYVNSVNLKFLNLTEDIPTTYGTLTMDNLEDDESTVIPIYEIDIYGDNIFRFQTKATYFGTEYSWATYNYQLSPIRPFVDSITLDIYPSILPSNGLNVSRVMAIVKDQYSEAIGFKPVFYTDDDAVGFITITPMDTWIDGTSRTTYKAGITPATVTIESTVTQYD